MRYWVFIRRCGECEEPSRILHPIDYMGFNFGHDGHDFYHSPEQALDVMGDLKSAIFNHAPVRRSAYWISHDHFPTIEDEIKWLEDNFILQEIEVL